MEKSEEEVPGEVKKSSFYVLFLGAKESKGLRGPAYIEPVLQFFVSQEHRMQALKVTLQVTTKGLRIIPCSSRIVGGETTGGTEKHFIPHHAITCVFQAPPPNDDIVACILLIYNPDTKCPVHVHCYRCDSPETASILKKQLDALVNREDNQKKFKDIEMRLQSKGLLPSNSMKKYDRGLTPEFDCRTSDSSDNSDRGFCSGSATSNHTSEVVASLYDSLAAELREKLNARKRNVPILLPPRDYDSTWNEPRGGNEGRRLSNPPGPSGRRNRRSYASREQESCGRSSGIGSAEDNCSPTHDQVLDNPAMPSSSDDEEWSPSQVVATQSSQYLVRPIWPTSGHCTDSSSIPPPLPKRPEGRQRSPDAATSPPPLPVFSRERFEGVRQKWENIDHQYNRQKSHDSLDDGYRSKEAAEADYRRQLSRESILRSLSRSKTGSKDSLDRWVENGVRSRGMWRRGDEEKEIPLIPSGMREIMNRPVQRKPSHQELPKSPLKGGGKSSRPDPGKVGKYRELDDKQRFPGLDKDTARVPYHGSNVNLSQHIYSEPSFDPQPTNKPKKFSFAFWK